MEEKIETPYMEPAKFDYNKFREETTNEALKSIYKIWAENADLLVYSAEATKENIEDNQAIVVQKMLEALIANKVPDCDMQYVIENFQATIYMLFNTLSRQKNELEKEFLARSIEARDPGTGKFSKEFSTVADLFTKLEKKRLEQDVDSNQYWIEKK